MSGAEANVRCVETIQCLFVFMMRWGYFPGAEMVKKLDAKPNHRMKTFPAGLERKPQIFLMCCFNSREVYVEQSQDIRMSPVEDVVLHEYVIHASGLGV